MFGTITSDMILAILPEISLLVLIAAVFIADLFLPEKRRPMLAAITIGGLALTILLTVLFSRPTGELMWGGMLRHDWLAFVSKLLFLTATLFITFFVANWKGVWHRGEFYVLLLVSHDGHDPCSCRC